LEHFVLIWQIFFRFWYHVPRKIWQPCLSLVYTNSKKGRTLRIFPIFAKKQKIRFFAFCVYTRPTKLWTVANVCYNSVT
jgi:hypothetical protein